MHRGRRRRRHHRESFQWYKMGICRRWRRSSGSSSSSINGLCMFVVFFANGVLGTTAAAADTADDAGLLDM